MMLVRDQAALQSIFLPAPLAEARTQQRIPDGEIVLLVPGVRVRTDVGYVHPPL